MASIAERIKRIQEKLGVEPDGVVGAETLTEAEKRLGIAMVVDTPKAAAPKPTRDAIHSLTPSKKGVQMIVEFEVGSEGLYRRRYQQPIWPEGRSGVTIGIGYDLGYASSKQIEADWGGRVQDAWVQDFKGVAGITGSPARDACEKLRGYGIKVPWEAAIAVFSQATLPSYAERALQAYPGLDKLPPDAQAAILSLVYNRGTKKSGASRSEMKELESAVAKRNLAKMAALVRQMKRLWEGKGLPGLLKRRDQEADLIANADHEYGPDDYLVV